ncbi:MAG TPA: PHP domain-containing protein, partial [Steroidobacteraceae bacterium]|nr:PHP domain-containing protein [Steroidobacteraceae bacterium]
GRAAFDLHTHSNCSDGSLPPGELVQRAAAAGVEVLALTDHDTIAGIEEAQGAAGRAGIELVPGVEISASWRSQAIHVLGLWIDPASMPLQLMLASQSDRRRIRMRKICARLAKLGLPGGALLAAVEANPGVPTRSHLAAALVAGGHVSRTDDAFRKYLGAGKAAHFAAEWPALAEVVGWIRAAGGIASLAHPIRYALSAGARRQLLADFAAAGGGALEVVTGGNGAQHSEACAALAVKFGLMGSIGSDFHNPQLAWNPLGRLAKLPDCVVPVWRGHL